MSPWAVLGWLLVAAVAIPVVALLLGVIDGAREVLRRDK